MGDAENQHQLLKSEAYTIQTEPDARIATPEIEPAPAGKTRVVGFIDGFNLYHALERFRRANTPEEKTKYQKYKWLCLSSLLKRYLNSDSEELCGVCYFTSLPPWDEAKRFRHETYLSALRTTGVQPILGHFKTKTAECRANCRREYETYEEKQTDVNIATSLLSMADSFDKAILLTEDSDQVPAVLLLRKLYPEKRVYVMAPIGRRSKDLEKVCQGKYTMTEEALLACQLSNPLPIVREGKQVSVLAKPASWQ